jgi:dihydroflavonol-4-reductase
MITLITGASGHVGANLIRSLLRDGRCIRVLMHRNHQALNGLPIETVYGDVRDVDSLLQACKGTDVVYHLAAIISIEMGNWQEIEAINIQGPRNVVEACLTNNVRRLIHFSSIHAFEQKPLNKPLDETREAVMPPCPPYDRSKAAGELEVRKGIERGLDAVIINPTAIVGPNDYQLSYFGQVILSMAQGKLPVLVNGGFDWVDVRDVVSGAMQAEKIAPTGSKYLLSGHWASLTEIARIVAEYSGAPLPFFTSPAWLAEFGAPFITAYAHLRRERPIYTCAAIKAIHSNQNISHAKATTELGYNPRPLKDTIHATLKWFEENSKLNRSYIPR